MFLSTGLTGRKQAKRSWYEKAKLHGFFHVQQLNRNHLFWPSLDVDLTPDMIEHPEKYPLVSRQVLIIQYFDYSTINISNNSPS
jgi:hypothetical protein